MTLYLILLFLVTFFAVVGSDYDLEVIIVSIIVYTVMYTLYSGLMGATFGSSITRLDPEYLELSNANTIHVVENTNNANCEFILYLKEGALTTPVKFTHFKVSSVSESPYRIKLDRDNNPNWYRWNLASDDTYEYYVPKQINFEFVVSPESNVEVIEK
jgi:hypothetical protein